MQVERLEDASRFLAATRYLRAADPVRTNVLGSIALGVLGGRTYDDEVWWVVRDENGKVSGCAARTAPHRLIVSPMPVAAASALGSAVASADPGVPGVNGPREVVDGVLLGLCSPRAASVTMTDVVYVLGTYVPPAPVPGGARRARQEELELVVSWTRQFQVDAGLPAHDAAASVTPRLAAGSLWLWEVDGTPVAMAGHADLVDTPSGAVARIGPVYTPEPLRRQGLGAAVTAAVIEELLPRATTVMLFADAANPTSNRIYARLGFRAAGEVVEVSLD